MDNLRTILLIAAILTSAHVLLRVILYFSRTDAGRVMPGRFSTFSVLTVLNFGVFWWVAGLSGGDALNGKVVDGQYFLGEHGRFTPVGFGFWLYSFAHAWVTILSLVGTLIGMIFRVRAGRLELKGDDEFHPGGRGTV